MKKDSFRTPEFEGFLIDYMSFIKDKNIFENHFGHFTKGLSALFVQMRYGAPSPITI